MFGIATIATGKKALLENKKCLTSIKKHLPDVPVITITKSLDNSDMVSSRKIKTSLTNHIPKEWQYCIYLDSDTRLLSDEFLVMIDILKSGYDLVIIPSANQDFWHIGETEKNRTFDYLGYHPLQLQGGVFAFAINSKTHHFFKCFSNEYGLYLNQDQCALVRALHASNLKTWLLGYPFNSDNGSVVMHLFGNTR